MQMWDAFLQKQAEHLGADVLSRWLRPLKVVHFDAFNLYLEAQDSFQIEWFEQHIRPRLKTEFVSNSGKPIKVHLTLKQNASPQLSPHKPAAPPITLTRDALDPRFTLESFIAKTKSAPVHRLFSELSTQSNEFPFSPVYLVGPGGSGKTHLLMALALALQDRGVNALYVKAETFTEHVVAAIRSGNMAFFRKTYRHVDALIVDDVHSLARKFATQEEFFHTFNALHAQKKQIVLASRFSPQKLQDIEPRLTSRFEWGIVLYCDKLQEEELKAVFRARCKDLEVHLPEEGIDFLLKSFGDIESLNKAFEALLLRCHLEGGGEITNIERIQSLLSDLLNEQKHRALTPEKIYAVVATAFGILQSDILGKSQCKEYSLPRQVAMYLCRKELHLPFPVIGRLFGRDHSTVMTSVKRVNNLLKSSDKYLTHTIADIRSRLQ